MNFLLMPSLEHIAIVKIVTTLWNQPDIRALIVEYNFDSTRSWWEIESKVIQKYWQLPAPALLQSKIFGVIKPIGNEIREWLEYNIKKCKLGMNYPDELCWTTLGTLDRRKTTEALTSDETIGITERYKLACIYCLENDIQTLWEEMPVNYKGDFYTANYDQQHNLVVFWTYYTMGDAAFTAELALQNYTSHQYAFLCATLFHDKVAAKYFFNMLTPEERGIVSTVGFVLCNENDIDVYLYIISQMNVEQQLKAVEEHAYILLLCLLDWPFQSLFMEVTNRAWDFLKDEYYYAVLETIIDKVDKGYRDYNYQELFGKFWIQSPPTHKKYVINQCVVAQNPVIVTSLISKMFDVKDEKNISLIFKTATPMEKEKMIFNSDGIYTCKNLFAVDELDLLKFFIRECISSQDKMIKFIDQCKSGDEWFGWSLQAEVLFIQYLYDLLEKWNSDSSLISF